MTTPPSCFPVTRRTSLIYGPPTSRNRRPLEPRPVFQPLKRLGRNFMSGGGVVFQMRDHGRFVRGHEGAFFGQAAFATFYAAAGLVDRIDVAIRAEAADRHVSPAGSSPASSTCRR